GRCGPSRRFFACSAIMLLATGLAFAARPSRPSPLPNFVLVVADGLRPDELGTRAVPTPALDQLAAQGIRFTQAYAGAPVDAASRAAIMTGQHTGHGRVRSELQVPLAPEDVTLAEVLRSVGYRSAAVGIWGLGWEGTTGLPTAQGFNEFLGCLDLVHGRDDQPAFLWRNEVPFVLKGNPGPAAAASAFEWMLRGATNFIRINEDHPFFLYFAPHLPGSSSELGAVRIPTASPFTNQTWTPSQRIRATRIAYLDEQVGKLVADLRKRNLDSETLVIVTSTASSDAANEMTEASKPRATPLSESNLRVPLIAWWPGKIAGGRTNNRPVAAWDIVPTLAQLANAPLPKQLDGRSFSALLLSQPPPTNSTRFYWEGHAGGLSQAGRIGQWKGVRALGKPSVAVYDLEVDPTESHDLAPTRRDLVAQFEALFAENSRTWSPPADGAVGAAGRPGYPIPTNVITQPLRTNSPPDGPATP
ncbi:MAG TPA: sulfatase-like hydrolase/transferase, partial [Verrucomicrobiota bacterium]|nr:sulfatase-like hydrolase/transferase [Verrucomicrobiota bacterium]